ncbi:MAG: hypothetical protein LBU25_04450 [Treponema sp.]|jgi:hypothetical protein|nr:hypothetical protein [Treponema sp.]
MDETVLNNVLASLNIMGKGMLGLFAVCGGIAVIMTILAKWAKRLGTKPEKPAGS